MDTETLYQRILRKNLNKIKKDTPRQATARTIRTQIDSIHSYWLPNKGDFHSQTENFGTQRSKSRAQGNFPPSAQMIMQRSLDEHRLTNDKNQTLDANFSQEIGENISDLCAQESLLLSSDCSFLNTSYSDTISEHEKRESSNAECAKSRPQGDDLNQTRRVSDSGYAQKRSLPPMRNQPSKKEGNCINPAKRELSLETRCLAQLRKNNNSDSRTIYPKTSRDLGNSKERPPSANTMRRCPRGDVIRGASTTRNSERSHFETVKTFDTHNSFSKKSLRDTGERETADSWTSRSVIHPMKRNKSITHVPTPMIMNLKIAHKPTSEFNQKLAEFQKRLRKVSCLTNSVVCL